MTDPVDIKDNTPNPETVAMLKKMLACAEKGEVRTVFMVCGWNDDAISTGWQRDARTTANRFLGGLVRGAMDFITAINLTDDGSSSHQCVSSIAHNEIYS